MHALQFWKAVTMDRSDFLERILGTLEKNAIRFCVVGGAGINAYAEPLVTRDLSIAIALDHIERAEQILSCQYNVRRFAHNINIPLSPFQGTLGVAPPDGFFPPLSPGVTSSVPPGPHGGNLDLR